MSTAEPAPLGALAATPTRARPWDPFDRWDRWTSARIDAPQLFTFRRVFAAIFLLYDVLDIAYRGTVSAMSWGSVLEGAYPTGLLQLQLVCVAAEVVLLLGRPREAVQIACAAEFLARWRIGDKYFGLNDFRFVALAALLLVFLPSGGRSAPRWLVDVWRWQTAWVYIATGGLKANDAFLSGGHLYVRHNYLRLRGWPYPWPISDLLARHWANRGFAVFTVVAEIGVGVLLLVPWRRARLWALVLAIAIHGGAAVLVDVWFFGALMITLVWCVSRQPVCSREAGRIGP